MVLLEKDVSVDVNLMPAFAGRHSRSEALNELFNYASRCAIDAPQSQATAPQECLSQLFLALKHYSLKKLLIFNAVVGTITVCFENLGENSCLE